MFRWRVFFLPVCRTCLGYSSSRMTLSTPSLLLSLDTATLSYPPLSPPQPLSPTSLSLHTYQSINQSIFISLSLPLSPFIDLNLYLAPPFFYQPLSIYPPPA